MRRKLRKNTSKLRKSSKTFKEDYTQTQGRTPAKKPKKGNVAKHKKKRSLQKKLKKLNKI